MMNVERGMSNYEGRTVCLYFCLHHSLFDIPIALSVSLCLRGKIPSRPTEN